MGEKRMEKTLRKDDGKLKAESLGRASSVRGHGAD